MGSSKLTIREVLSSNNEEQWLFEWLYGKHHEEEIQQHLSNVTSVVNPKGAVVCVCRMERELEGSTYSYSGSFFRTFFQSYGLFCFTVMENNQFVFILINLREYDWKIRVSKALDQIRQTDVFKLSSSNTPIFGVGKYIESLHKLSDSYTTAKEVLQIQKKANILHEIFYENLHIYRLVSILHKQDYLLEFMNEYIGLVIEYDQNHKSELLHTLTVLLESNGSKKDAANRLFIVRQTLYHRLDKLKDLLGDDFMTPAKRLAIEMSLYIHRYVSSSKPSSEIRAIQ